MAPEIDETRQPGESPENLVMRLATAKVQALVSRFNHGLIIGSDQVAALGDDILTKPVTLEKATAQLARQSGKTVCFYTSVCVLNAQTGNLVTDLVTTSVRFRQLSDQQIRSYLERESPFDCAGSFKAEGLGIVLFDSIESTDPTALIGLPLIALGKLLSRQKLEFI